jgi:hypothetical protein
MMFALPPARAAGPRKILTESCKESKEETCPPSVQIVFAEIEQGRKADAKRAEEVLMNNVHEQHRQEKCEERDIPKEKKRKPKEKKQCHNVTCCAHMKVEYRCLTCGVQITLSPITLANSRLLPSSMSLGVPVSRVTQCMSDG